jgi:DNA-binding transcriptional MerR regulator
METRLSIGDFSRMTHLSIKALRHYHELGVLEPDEIDPMNGYRFYSPEQVPAAQVVRRFRELGMPVDEVREILHTPDPTERNQVVVAHLKRMEDQLNQVEETVRSLRKLLEGPADPPAIEYRSAPAASVFAIREPVSWDEAAEWTLDAAGDLYRALESSGIEAAGPPGSLYPSEFFQLEAAEVTLFVPVPPTAADPGKRVNATHIPGAELAVALHRGPFVDLDQTYGALGTVVAGQAIGVEGPIREYYLVSPLDTPDESLHRTEVAWPIFRTA